MNKKKFRKELIEIIVSFIVILIIILSLSIDARANDCIIDGEFICDEWKLNGGFVKNFEVPNYREIAGNTFSTIFGVYEEKETLAVASTLLFFMMDMKDAPVELGFGGNSFTFKIVGEF